MPCRIAIGIPTVGRATILCETLRELALQTRQPDAVIVCGTKAEDMAGAEEACPGALLLVAKPGLPRQRNAAIAAAADIDIMVFFDDDFLADPTYIASVERQFVSDPTIVVATGLVLADGIGGPGLTPTVARTHLAAPSPPAAGVQPVFTAYGCNMAVRLKTMRDKGVLFDERLPLYGWQEDVDLSLRLSPYGKVVKINEARGVHLGVKMGRNSGVRLGYSQVANPLYLSKKRLGYPLRRALTHIACNIAMNVVRSPRPEPYVDRRGRVWGNLLAIRDLFIGRMAPERILDL
jgi:GT2 family glycosyltransferase